jgi:23S rRNA (guanosine2251-2'-O)-methyltransferase
MPTRILIAHNLRSTHNVGSLLRTAEGLGVRTVYLTGYTPYPQNPYDDRLPHISQKLHRQIHKTALGAEDLVDWQVYKNIDEVFALLSQQDIPIYAIEQAPGSTALPSFQPPDTLALVVGREVEGIEPEVLAQCDGILEIPMAGRKESFNVVQAAAMTLYHCTFL